MKHAIIMLASLMSATAFAANAGPLTLPVGAKINKSNMTYAKPMKGQMGCNLYSLKTLDDDNYDAKLLASKKGQVINVGDYSELNMSFPAPYEKIGVYFIHASVAYTETGYENFRPELLAGMVGDISSHEPQEVSFTLDDVRSGSDIMLRGGVSKGSERLFYQCSMTFLK